MTSNLKGIQNMKLARRDVYRQIGRFRTDLGSLNAFETVAYGPSSKGSNSIAGRRECISGAQLKRASSNTRQGKWLASLACWVGRTIGQPISILEVGTCAGISGSYLLAGMSEANGGRLITFEGSPEIAELARKNMDTLIRDNSLQGVEYDIIIGPFEDTLSEFLQAPGDALHLAFIDGNHIKEATLEYHGQVRKRMHELGVIIHDDIAWSDGMADAWRIIQQKEGIGRTAVLNQGGLPSRGIVFLGAPLSGSCEAVHLDTILERIVRTAVRRARAFRR